MLLHSVIYNLGPRPLVICKFAVNTLDPNLYVCTCICSYSVVYLHVRIILCTV